MKQYHSWKPLLDRGRVVNIAEGARDVGKSYPMLLRAMRRMVREHRSIVWLRRTDEEIADWLSSFGSAKWRKLATQARIDPDKLRRHGALILYNEGDEKHPDWVKLLRAGAVSGWKKFRDTDDPREELIYLDEAFTTVEDFRRYRGNEVEHTLDILKSLRRGDGSDMRLVVAGNAERAVNPWFDYFGIKEPPINAGCIDLAPSAHGGSLGLIGYERIVRVNERDALDSLLHGTALGDFLDGCPKGRTAALLMPMPKRATLYANVDFGTRLSLWLTSDGFLICSLRHAAGRVVRMMPNGDPNSVMLTPQIRKQFTTLRRAWSWGKVRFETQAAQEIGLHALSRLI